MKDKEVELKDFTDPIQIVADDVLRWKRMNLYGIPTISQENLSKEINNFIDYEKELVKKLEKSLESEKEESSERKKLEKIRDAGYNAIEVLENLSKYLKEDTFSGRHQEILENLRNLFAVCDGKRSYCGPYINRLEVLSHFEYWEDRDKRRRGEDTPNYLLEALIEALKICYRCHRYNYY